MVEGPGSTGLVDGPGLVSGTIYISHADAQQAQLDVTKAYNGLAAMSSNFDLTGQDLGGLTLTPGVYKFAAEAQLTGDLTLDAQGDNNAYWVFQIGSTLTTASASNVLFSNVGTQGGTNHGLFWQVGSSATLGTTSVFEGNILAFESITLTTSAQIHNGRALARTGAVTMDSNDLSMFSPFPNNGTLIGGLESDLNGNIVPINLAAVPEPGSFLPIASGLVGLICLRKRFQSAV